MPAQPTRHEYRILVTDDDALSGILAGLSVESLGHHASLVSSGELALQALAFDDYDAVLMDCKMPGMDGFETTRRLRENLRFQGLPIIACTADLARATRERCLASGMDEYLAKPFCREELARKLSRFLRPPRQAR